MHTASHHSIYVPFILGLAKLQVRHWTLSNHEKSLVEFGAPLKFYSSPAVSEEQEEGEIVEEDGNTADPSVDKCSDPTGATGMEEYEERRVFYHSSSGYYYDPVSAQAC